jgi:NAD(P)H dehydrogenase (quinone)
VRCETCWRLVIVHPISKIFPTIPALTRGGAGESYANLIRELYVAHNAGLIDVEPGGKVRLGTTELGEAFRALLG